MFTYPVIRVLNAEKILALVHYNDEDDETNPALSTTTAQRESFLQALARFTSHLRSARA